jgi:acetyl-CoA carboxylase biotin carboxyl carrier protein
MDAKELKKLLDAMKGSEVSELTLETGDYKLTVRRGGEAQAVSQPAASQPAQASPPAPSAEPAQAAASKDSNLVEVTAPIVGTFYAAPAPDSPDYVKVGDRVQPGAVLCIIEAMKLMNEIEAEVAGTIAEILVKNEDPVEYGQVLFRIEPD